MWGVRETDDFWFLNQRDPHAPFPAPAWHPPSPFSKCAAPVKIPARYLQARSLRKGMAGSQGVFQPSCREGRLRNSIRSFSSLARRLGAQTVAVPSCGRTPRPSARPASADAFRRHPRPQRGGPAERGCLPRPARWIHMRFSGTTQQRARCVSHVL